MKRKSTPSKRDIHAAQARKDEIRKSFLAILIAAILMAPTYFLFSGMDSTVKHDTQVTVVDKGYRKGLRLHGETPTLTYKRQDGHSFRLDTSAENFAARQLGDVLVISVNRGQTGEVKASESWIFFGGMISTGISIVLASFGLVSLFISRKNENA
ncbi:hypothetical protein RYA05_01680 [Pseudomonas syringae pv. actinidiae]|nr:hypothetical protein [Pseudomonas syringae pv. actinidiae]